jgi:hypothetical protein
MKITKTQLQKLIREEISTLSEDEQIDELFGFGKKAKAKKEKARLQKQRMKNPGGMTDDEAAAEEEGFRQNRANQDAEEAERNSPEYKAMQKKASLAYGGSAKGPSTRERNIALDRQRADKAHSERKEMERRRKAGTGPKIDYARKTDFYGVNNRKDESQLRKRIKEEVSKALKANFTFKK